MLCKSLRTEKIMTDNIDNSGSENISDIQENESIQPNRRRMLMMGAVAATTVIAVRPAMAQSAASVSNCTIKIPGGHAAGKWIQPDGSLVAPDTEGAFAPPHRTYSRQEIYNAFYGHDLPGSDYGASRAYVNYMKRLRRGQSGFTCFASIQFPR